jgi:hypothetical protein
MKLASFEWLYPRCDERLFDQVITIPHVFIASEAEKMIRDAAAGCRELDLVGAGGHDEYQCRRSYSHSWTAIGKNVNRAAR